MFVSPHISRLPYHAVSTYLKLLATLMKSLPIHALDPEAAAKKRSTQSLVDQGDADSGSDYEQGISVIAVNSFAEPLSPPKLDNRTAKRLRSIMNISHISSLFAIANKHDTVLFEFVVFLLALILVWPSQKGVLLNAVAGFGNGGIIRLLYRQYVSRSQIGQSDTNFNGLLLRNYSLYHFC